MSLDAFTRRQLVMAIEATEGSAETLDPATGSILLLNGASEIQGEVTERNIDQAKFGNRPFVFGNRRGSISGQFEMIGASTVGDAAPIGPLLQVGGMAETLSDSTDAVYNSITTDIPSYSAKFYHSGTSKQILGARAALTGFTFDIGGFFLGNVRLEGQVDTLDEETIPGAVDVSSFQAPPTIQHDNAVLTMNSENLECTSFGFDFGNTLQTVEHTEGKRSMISDRRGTFSATFFRPLKATFDPYTLQQDNTTFAIQVQVGTTPKSVTSDFVLAQIETVRETDVQGFFAYEVTGRLLADTGDDDIIFTFA